MVALFLCFFCFFFFTAGACTWSVDGEEAKGGVRVKAEVRLEVGVEVEVRFEVGVEVCRWAGRALPGS